MREEILDELTFKYEGEVVDREMRLVQFKKMIKHDSMVSQKFDKAPEELQFCTNVDQMTAGVEKNLLKNFFVLRRLMDLPNDTSMLTQDQSLPSKWSQNDFIALPKERKY
jgi:hypothetical protein